MWILGLLALITGVAAQQSVGCFKSTTLDPDLTVKVAKRIHSPEQCIKECKARYYMYSGLMNGYECYCDSHYGKHGPSDKCNIECPDDPTTFCGSDEAISIWATEQTASSPPRNLEAIRASQFILEVTWQPPELPNGKIISYTLKTMSLNTRSFYPLPPTEVEVLGESSNTTILYGLHPGTKYNITIFATNMNMFSNVKSVSEKAFTEAWTQIGPPNEPPPPKILSRDDQTITIEVPEGSSESGPLSYYYVVVVQAGTIAPTGSDILYDNYYKADREGTGYYITGKFDVADYPQYKRFIVGDGRMIGGYYNAPLNTSYMGIPRIGIALESRVQSEVQYSYSDLTSYQHKIKTRDYHSSVNAANIILWILIVLLSILLLSSVIFFIILRKKFQQVRMQRLPETQELTLQGPLFEVDNMGYIPEEVPERANHYQELKNKVWSIPQNFLDFDPNYVRRGRFGTVHLGTVQRDNTPVAVAIHKISDTQLSRSEKRKMLRELDVCIKAGTSKYLASLVGNCEIPDTLFVAMEWPPQNLKQRLLASRSGDNFPYEQILKIGAKIADALRHLESLKILHTCVCARSVGLEIDWTPKLIGHGLSKYSLEDVKYARWTAVECFSNQVKHNPGVVWAYGVLLWEMFSMGGTPYHNLEMDSDVEDAINAGQRLQQLNDMTDPIYEVMSSCWLTDPEERPTFDELVRLDTLSIIPITTITEPYRPELELNT